MKKIQFLCSAAMSLALLCTLACATTKPTGPAPEPELLMSENASQKVDLGGLEVSADWELNNPTTTAAAI